jgi:hypothetical protein
VGKLIFIALMLVGTAEAAVTNVYWRVDLHQGSYIIAYGQSITEQGAWDDCFRLTAITRAMTAAETRRNAVAAITSPVVRWCQNPKRYSTVSPDPVVPPPPPPVDCVVSAWSAWSDPAWLACVDGMQSRSIVRTRTIVTQPANGGAACPSLVETQPQTRVCPGTAIVSWSHDGLNTTEYRITHWRDGELPSVYRVAGNLARRAVVDGLPPGPRSFHVSAAYCPPALICNVSNPTETGSKVIL